MRVRKDGDEARRLVLGAIKAHKTITAADIAKVLGKPKRSVYAVCRVLEQQGYVQAQELDDAQGRRLVWSLVVNAAGTPRPKRNTPDDPDYWVPQPWVHPYRKRILEG